MTIEILESSRDFVKNYDSFFIDIWGVVHDGDNLRPGILEFLKQLANLKKQVLFFSNAPRKAEHVQKKLSSLGIEPNLYEKIVTSGEVARDLFKKKKILTEAKKYFLIGHKTDDDLLLDTHLEKVTDLEEADFILNLGFGSLEFSRTALMPEILEKAAEKGLLMLCCNPDLTVEKDNQTIFCAGYIAEKYKEFGGKVTYVGKPYVEMYDFAKSFAKSSKILAIGDSFYTDILGANISKIDSILVVNGIFRKQLVNEITGEFSLENFQKLSDHHQAKPTKVTLDLFW